MHRFRTPTLLLFILALALRGAAQNTTASTPPANAAGNLTPPPLAEVRPVQDTYFGTTLTDPYRYFENIKDPEVQAWFKSQANYAQAKLAAIPGRDALLARMVELSNSAPARVTDLTEVPGRFFYLQRKTGENQYKLYTRTTMDAPETLLLDPDTLKGSDGAPVAINFFHPSPNGNYVACGVSHGGSEDASIRVVQVPSGKDTGLVIERGQFDGVNWRDDESGFWYCQLQNLPPGAPDVLKYQDAQMRYHRLGTDPAKDPVVFGTQALGGANITSTETPYINTIFGDPRVFGIIQDGVRNEFAAYISTQADLDAGHPAWRKLFDFDDLVTDYAVHEDNLYLVTHQDAPRYKLELTSVDAPDLSHAIDVIAPGEAVVESVEAAQDALYVTLLEAGLYRLQRVLYNPAMHPVEVRLPLQGTLDDLTVDPRIDGAIFFLTSWTDAGGYYAYDPDADTVSYLKLQPRGPNDQPPNLVAEEVLVPSYDGVPVPMSIVHPTKMPMD